ncbi:hypothetical protein COP2_024733 [Malus domestica]
MDEVMTAADATMSSLPSTVASIPSNLALYTGVPSLCSHSIPQALHQLVQRKEMGLEENARFLQTFCHVCSPSSF